MKISSNAPTAAATNWKNQTILPLVPETVKYKKEQMMSFRLRTAPADADSPTYDVYVPYVTGSEDLRACLTFMQSIAKVCTGMNVLTGPNKHEMTVRCLKDTALTAYQGGIDKNRVDRQLIERGRINQLGLDNGDDQPTRDADMLAVVLGPYEGLDWAAGLEALCAYMAPYKVLSRVKLQLRRHTRKPADMTIREFYNHFCRINLTELAMLPPLHNATQCLEEDEVIDIIIYAMPSSWVQEMERQGHDPTINPIIDTIDFAERIEAAESPDQHKSPSKSGYSKNSSKKKSGSPKNGNSGSGGSDGYYCLHHGNNTSHETNDCIFLANQSKKAKSGSNWRDEGIVKLNHKYSSGSKNKSWTRGADADRDKNKKDLATFMRQQVRKEMNAYSKKRKSGDAGSLNNVESDDEGTIDLGELNYADMGDLKIDSDDSSVDLDLDIEDGECMA